MPFATPAALQRPIVMLLGALVLALVAYDLYWLLAGLTQPPLGSHSFRQSQTAISAYWLLKGGPLIAYETPILGAPWSIPFEFPLYQWFVAALAWTGLSIDVAGRLVASGFFLGCLWPMRMLCRQYRMPETTFLIAAALFLAAPIYAFWSRTIMIETTALFFGLVWLAFFARLQERPSLVPALVTFLAGTACVLAKSTTFPAFVVIGFLIFATALIADLRRRAFGAALVRCIIAGMVTLGPLAIGAVWVRYSDIVKLRSEGGSLLTSAVLTEWNFGEWPARFAAKLWVDTIADRVAKDMFGRLGWLAALLALFALTQRRYRFAALLCVIGFMVPFLVFTNLHTTHNYYQVANAIFAIGAAAIGIQALLDRVWIGGVAALAALLVAQISFFQSGFGREIRQDFTQEPTYRAAEIVKRVTPENSVVIVFGQDWSSLVPYLAERRGAVMSTWFPRSMFESLFQRPDAFLGGLPVGAIVDCGTTGYDGVNDLIQAYLADRAVIGEAGSCRVLAATKS